MNSSQRNRDYRPLQDDEDLPVAQQVAASKTTFSVSRRVVVIYVAFHLLLLFLRVLSARSSECSYPNAQILYSPAQDIFDYKVVKFHSILGGGIPDIFDGPPSPDLDAAWEELYDSGISRITETQASRLVNYTIQIPHEPSGYLVGIDVFHQLHCLNILRKYLSPEYYVDENFEQRNIHIAHCVNSIRQSLQCSSDISTVVWKLTPRADGGVEPLPQFDVLHSCKDFGKIREWAAERHTGYSVDGPDDPHGPSSHDGDDIHL